MKVSHSILLYNIGREMLKITNESNEIVATVKGGLLYKVTHPCVIATNEFHLGIVFYTYTKGKYIYLLRLTHHTPLPLTTLDYQKLLSSSVAIKTKNYNDWMLLFLTWNYVNNINNYRIKFYKYILTSNISKDYQQVPNYLYRGLILPKSSLARLENKQYFTLKPRKVSSWSTNIDVAYTFAERRLDKTSVGYVIKKKIPSSEILLDIDTLLLDYFTTEEYENLSDYALEQEYLVKQEDKSLTRIDSSNLVKIYK